MCTFAVFWTFLGYLGTICPLVDSYPPSIGLNTRVTNHCMTDNGPLAPATPPRITQMDILSFLCIFAVFWGVFDDFNKKRDPGSPQVVKFSIFVNKKLVYCLCQDFSPFEAFFVIFWIFGFFQSAHP